MGERRILFDQLFIIKRPVVLRVCIEGSLGKIRAPLELFFTVAPAEAVIALLVLIRRFNLWNA